jgi:hypothetical protein
MKSIYDYTEGQEIPVVPFLNDEEYKKSILVNPNPCTDCLIINKENKTVLFPIRIAETGAGYWFIGGVWKAQKSVRENMVSCFERETKLNISSKRFERVQLEDSDGIPVQTLWPTGRNDMHFIFSIELTAEEIKTVSENLDPREYNKEAGLKEFTLEELKKTDGVRGIIIDAVTLVFKEQNEINREVKKYLKIK